MSELMRLIQWHLDRYGVKQAAFAKKIGSSPQTVNNWKQRGGTLPRVEHLKAVADATGIPYLLVLDAALLDAGYRDSLVDDVRTLRTRIARLARETDGDTLRELEDFIVSGWAPPEGVDEVARPGMYGPALDEAVNTFFTKTDETYGYGNAELLLPEVIREAISDRVGELEQEESAELPDDVESVLPGDVGPELDAAAGVVFEPEVDHRDHGT